MLTENEKQEIQAEFGHYPKKQAVCIDALKVVQNHRGWVSDENVQDIAQFLEMTPEEVEAVASFYSLIFRKPVGKNVVLICDSLSCWIRGYDKIVQRITDRLGVGLGE